MAIAVTGGQSFCHVFFKNSDGTTVPTVTLLPQLVVFLMEAGLFYTGITWHIVIGGYGVAGRGDNSVDRVLIRDVIV